MKALLIALFLIVCIMSKTVDANHDYYYYSGLGGLGGLGSSYRSYGMRNSYLYPSSSIIRRTIIRRPLYNSYSSFWKHNKGESHEDQ
jgi:hypothetical protein